MRANTGELVVCEAHGGPAHGRHLQVGPDPTDPLLPAATVTLQVDNHAEAKVMVAEYVRSEISEDTHRWVYRPARGPADDGTGLAVQ